MRKVKGNKMKIYPICVPTCKRGFYHTLKYLANTPLEVYVYCQPQDYIDNYASDQELMAVKNFTFITDTPVGLCHAMNYIIQDQLERGNQKVFILDDDVMDFRGIRRKDKHTENTFNETYKMEPIEFFTTWQNNIPDDCVASGPSWSGFNGMSKNIGNQESIKHLDGRVFFNIKVLNDYGIKFEPDLPNHRNFCLQILKNKLPVPIMHGMLETKVVPSSPNTSIIFGIQNNNMGIWSRNLQKKWGKEIIKISKDKHFGNIYKLAPIKKLKEHFGYKKQFVFGNTK